MKFTVNREKLKVALQKVGSIIGSHSVTPIMGNVLIQAEEGCLTLTTTNVDMRLSTKVDALVEEAGAITAPAKKLASLVGLLLGVEVIFEVNDKDRIKIKCGTSNFTLLGFPATDFPGELVFDINQEVKLKESIFKRMVSSIFYAASPDDSRKVLTGILLSVRESTMTLVATDGKRLAIQERILDDANGGDVDAIIPLKAATEVRSLLDGDSQVLIEIGEKQCFFTGHDFKFSTKLIDGTYPNYRQVIPSNFTQTVEIPTAVFLSKIDMIRLVLKDASSFIVLQFADNKLTLEGSSSEIGEGRDFVEVEYSGESLDVTFNPVFLADPLRNNDSNFICMKIYDPLNPVVIEGEEGFLYVIMPIRNKKTS